MHWFLFFIVKKTASEIINVSKFVEQHHQINHLQNHLLYNCIDDQFVKNVKLEKRIKDYSHILMVCSLKKYKGIIQFIQLANDLPNYQFQLVLNADDNAIKLFLKEIETPQNLRIHAKQQVLHSFYHWADLVVNLSLTSDWVETFGLTMIEAMTYGIPTIAPNIGGITEVVVNAYNGLNIDSRNRQALKNAVLSILTNQPKYQLFSTNAFKQAAFFSEELFEKKSLSILLNRL